MFCHIETLRMISCLFRFQLDVNIPAMTAHGTSEMRNSYLQPVIPSRVITNKDQFKHPNTICKDPVCFIMCFCIRRTIHIRLVIMYTLFLFNTKILFNIINIILLLVH